MKTEVYPLALPVELYEQIRTTAKKSGLSIADVMRLSLKAGHPHVSRELGSERVTNVDPLPDAVANKLYRERKDDESSIRRFIAAQPKHAT